MKKIVYGIATLTLAASILGACSNGEATTTNKNEDTKQEAKAETTESTKLSSGVQFVYNGKEVTDKELKNHQKEYLNWVAKEYINPSFLAKNYVLTNEFFNYLGTSESEFDKEYQEHVKRSKDGGLQSLEKGQYLTQFLSFKMADKELTDKELKELYNKVVTDKEKMPFVSFKSNKSAVFQNAVKEKVIVPKEVEDKVMKQANITNKDLDFNHKLTENDYMPF